MTQRQRKFVGTLALIAYVVFYALLIMSLTTSRIGEAPKWLQMLFYAVAGIAWILPLMPLIRWMERKDA